MTPSIAAFLAGMVRVLSGVTVRWVDCEPDTRQRVYFGNHTSHLDCLLLWSALPREIRALTRPLAAKDYWATGSLRHWATRLFQAVLIERVNLEVSERNAQVDLMFEALGAGNSLIMFPEGTRRAGPEVGPFKSGLYHLSLRKPGLEVVPVHLDNLYRILPKGEILPVPMLSCVSFGRPLQLLDGEPKDAFLERAREGVCRLKPS